MKKLPVIIALLGILGGLAFLLWGGLEENLVYFVTPSELKSKGPAAVGEYVRLGGVVARGTIASKESVVRFDITDNTEIIHVVTHSAPTQMFQASMGVVVEGALQESGDFLAERVMIKHNEEYHPPKEGEMPHEVYKQISN
jgi:cytochrome c-type biogenesis protein CcmE